MPKKLPSLANAIAAADVVLLEASELQLYILANNQYTDDAEKQRRLIEVGELTTARHEIEWLRSNASELRSSCNNAKYSESTRQLIIESIKSGRLNPSVIAADIINRLPDFAAENVNEMAQESFRYQIDWPDEYRYTADDREREMMQARADAAKATEKLNEVPALLARVVELLEAGELRQARTLLN